MSAGKRGILPPRRAVRVVAATSPGLPCRLSRLLRLLLGRLPRCWRLAARPAPVGVHPGPLRNLTLAALALPHMIPASAQALEVEDLSFQYGHYSEGDKAFWSGPAGAVKAPDPFRSETQRASARFRLGDRSTLRVDLGRDTWSGATPYLTAPEAFVTVTGASAVLRSTGRVLKATLTPIAQDATNQWVAMPGLVNLVTSASPETRNEGNLTLSHEWDEFTLDLGASVSDEPDYRYRGISLAGRKDFNRKLTTLSFGASRGKGDVAANLGPYDGFADYDMYRNAASGPRITTVYGPGLVSGIPDANAGTLLFSGEREGKAANLGFSQVLDRVTTVSLGYHWSRDSGFLESPHKLTLMAFANPALLPGAATQSNTNLFGVAENRPEHRNAHSWNLHLARYLSFLDAAVHLDYGRSRDDWGVRARGLELTWAQSLGGGWSLTPSLRHYAQSAARFYRPYFLFDQKYPQVPGQPGVLDISMLPVDYWSSDQRLSAFGTRAVGLTLAKRLDRGMRLELSWEHTRHAGKWGLEGVGDGYADFSSNLASIVLAMDYATAARDEFPLGGHAGHGHAGHGARGPGAPAGVMYAHMLDRPGVFMAEYRYLRSRQGGGMRRGGKAVSDADVLAACGAAGCAVAPEKMTMDMHMLHLMYAASEDVSLMLMPQFMSMEMDNRVLAGGFYTPVGTHSHADMDLSGHGNGGAGDTQAGALLRLARGDAGEALLGLALSIPTGSVKAKMSHGGGELMDYGMQTGSGSWDFLPSLTYLGGRRAWSWGGQLSGVKRLGGYNDTGYILGDAAQATLWTGYAPTPRLGLTLRLASTWQGAIHGTLQGAEAVVDAFGNVTWPRSQHSPADLAGNYGGRFNDLGLGMSVAVPGLGGHLGVEWLRPFGDRPRGDQLRRGDSLVLNWSLMF